MFAKWKRLKEQEHQIRLSRNMELLDIYINQFQKSIIIHYLRICFQLCDIKFSSPISFSILSNNFTPISADFPNTKTKRSVLILHELQKTIFQVGLIHKKSLKSLDSKFKLKIYTLKYDLNDGTQISKCIVYK